MDAQLWEFIKWFLTLLFGSGLGGGFIKLLEMKRNWKKEDTEASKTFLKEDRIAAREEYLFLLEQFKASLEDEKKSSGVLRRRLERVDEEKNLIKTEHTQALLKILGLEARVAQQDTEISAKDREIAARETEISLLEAELVKWQTRYPETEEGS